MTKSRWEPWPSPTDRRRPKMIGMTPTPGTGRRRAVRAGTGALMALLAGAGDSLGQSLDRDIEWGYQQFLTREYRPFWDERYENLSFLSYRNFPIRGEQPRYDPFGLYLLDGSEILRIEEYRTLHPGDSSRIPTGPEFRTVPEPGDHEGSLRELVDEADARATSEGPPVTPVPRPGDLRRHPVGRLLAPQHDLHPHLPCFPPARKGSPDHTVRNLSLRGALAEPAGRYRHLRGDLRRCPPARHLPEEG